LNLKLCVAWGLFYVASRDHSRDSQSGRVGPAGRVFDRPAGAPAVDDSACRL